MAALLAFDTATERMSVALQVDTDIWLAEDVGGAHASAALLPAIEAMLSEAQVHLRQLDAIAYGRGPGAFTGLRTACSVAQGLAFGSGLPVLPIDTLLAVAEDARSGAARFDVWVAMDARMGEVYAAHYLYGSDDLDGWQVAAAPMLIAPDALQARWAAAPPLAVAGSALDAYGALTSGDALRLPHAWPRAAALPPLAEAAWRRGEARDAALALPLYLRDKVALTTAERAARQAEKVLR